MLGELERILQGQVHLYLPEGSGLLGQLGAKINQLHDEVRQARLGLREDQILDQAMARESPNGLVVIVGDGSIRRLNKSMLTLLPPLHNPYGKTVQEAFGVPELTSVLEEAARTRSVSERVVSLNRRHLLLRGVPLADGVGCLGVVLDVTSVRMAEQARRDFVANVSHELRTPITAIIGYSEALVAEAEELPEDLRPMVVAVERNAKRLSALVEDVLELSKLDSRISDMPLDRERLAPLVGEVLEHLGSPEVQVEVDPQLEALVNAKAFVHALGNLVDNALKYTPAGGQIVIRAKKLESRVRVEVQDSGPGIAPEHLERVFERFYRVDEGRWRAAGGTGLGLALVKNLCRVTRAEVLVESKVGEGSCFILNLPVS
jgi:two-component system phosphate regulon sensor histidine kinase PhoR